MKENILEKRHSIELILCEMSKIYDKDSKNEDKLSSQSKSKYLRKVSICKLSIVILFKAFLLLLKRFFPPELIILKFSLIEMAKTIIIKEKERIIEARTSKFELQVRHFCLFFKNLKVPLFSHAWQSGPVYPVWHFESFPPLLNLKKKKNGNIDYKQLKLKGSHGRIFKVFSDLQNPGFNSLRFFMQKNASFGQTLHDLSIELKENVPSLHAVQVPRIVLYVSPFLQLSKVIEI